MIAPTVAYTTFSNDEEKLSMFRQWKLIPVKATWFRELLYSGLYVNTPTPCDVVGYIDDRKIVLKIAENLHTINVEYFSQMQTASSIPSEYVVLDLETTGLSPARDKIVEIAAIKYRSAEAIGSFHSLVNPNCIMPLTAQAIHGITDAMVADAPCIENVLPQLSEFLGALPIVAHNAPFDISFLKNAFDQIGMKFVNKAFDTLKLSQKSFPNFLSYTLSDLIKYLDIPITESHRAFPDVQATAILFQKCFENNTSLEPEPVAAPAKKVRSDQPPATAGYFATRVLPPDYEEALVVYDEVDELVFDQKTFVITGDIANHTRSELQEIIESRGGKITGVNRKLDYLVVGMQNKNLIKDTAHAKSTKIIKAEQLRDEGYPIKIISDEFFISQLEVQYV